MHSKLRVVMVKLQLFLVLLVPSATTFYMYFYRCPVVVFKLVTVLQSVLLGRPRRQRVLKMVDEKLYYPAKAF